METQSPGMSGGGVVHTQTYRPHASHLSPTRRCLRRRELAAFFRGKRKLPRGVPSLAPNPRPHGAFLDPGRLLPGDRALPAASLPEPVRHLCSEDRLRGDCHTRMLRWHGALLRDTSRHPHLQKHAQSLHHHRQADLHRHKRPPGTLALGWVLPEQNQEMEMQRSAHPPRSVYRCAETSIQSKQLAHVAGAAEAERSPNVHLASQGPSRPQCGLQCEFEPKVAGQDLGVKTGRQRSSLLLVPFGPSTNGTSPTHTGESHLLLSPPPQLKRQPPPETSLQTRQKLCLIRASRDSVRSAGKMNYHDRTRWPFPLRLPRAWPLQASFPTLFPTLRHPTRSPVPLAHIGGVARARTLVKPVDASGPSQRARPLCVTGRSPQTPGSWNTTLLGVPLSRAPLHLLPRCLRLCPSTELMGSSLLLHAAPEERPREGHEPKRSGCRQSLSSGDVAS